MTTAVPSYRAPWKPTEARGAELAREILTDIEAEEARKEQKGHYPALKAGHVWNQNIWGRVEVAAIPKSTTFSVVKASNDTYGYVHAALPAGVSCGTAMCFAGHASLAVGDRFVLDLYATDLKPDLGKNKNLRKYAETVEEVDTIEVENVLTPKGKLRSVSERARKLLGLEYEEGEVMFAPENDLADLRRYVEMMEAGLHLVTGKPKK